MRSMPGECIIKKYPGKGTRTNHVRLQKAQNEREHAGHDLNRSQPVPSSASLDLGTGVWQNVIGQWMMVGSKLHYWMPHKAMCNNNLPFSISLFSLSLLHRCSSASVTTCATSSAFASRFTLIHSGSGHRTLPMSPSMIHDCQKSLRHRRQKVWLHDNRMHFVPFSDSRHIEHG